MDIDMFWHCKKCLEELPTNTAPRDWVRIEGGWTKVGFQIWCVRHEMNVLNIDLDGQKVTRIA